MTKRTCTRCGAELPFTAEFFPRSANTKSGLESTCRVCRYGKSSRPQEHQRHVRRRKHELPPPRQHICSECCNLPHARPATGCPSCGKPFAEETPVTLEYGSAFTVDRSVFPEGGA